MAWRTVVDSRSDSRAELVSVLACIIWWSETGRSLVSVRLDATPASAGDCPYLSDHRVCDVHLWVDPDAPSAVGRAEHADVLVAHAPLPPAAARRSADELIARYPGALVVAVPDSENGCVLAVRGSGNGTLSAWLGAGKSCCPAPPQAVASVVHTWLVAGGSLESLRSVRLHRPGGCC
ncbi:hypothetical protein [Streptomyces sp. NPDC059743]|uniref:hypothetical protein n=1 Tax=Streptomyces sp. NPDC059743 TaxID=3346928 RepID=UPI0036491314